MVDLRNQLAALAPWHFDIELAGGLRTTDGNRTNYENRDHRGMKNALLPDQIRPLFRRLFGESLEGRSFLDVGCNAGGYCFVAKDMGAGRVLGFDVRDHWIEQAHFVQRHGLTRDRDAIEFQVMHLRDLPAETFDVTLFKGVFYHLPDPIHALLRLCELTRDVLIVASGTAPGIPGEALLSFRESKTKVMSGVDGLCWIPGGPQALINILNYGGFAETEVVFQLSAEKTGRARGRCGVVAARTAEGLRRYREGASDGSALAATIAATAEA